GAKMEFANWKTPAPIDTEAWTLVSADGVSVVMSKDMELLNYAGTTLKIKADRSVTLIGTADIHSDLGITLDNSVKAVAFRTENSLTNAGPNPWDEQSGAPCMWSLDMF